MKKIWLIAVLLLCVFLCGCADLQPVDGVQLRTDLAAYYENQVYSVDGVEERLILPYAPQVIEQTIDKRKNTAYLRCRAQAVSEYQLFAREDTWELWYTYDRKNKCWTLADQDYSETTYKLLTDLSQERCAALMPVPDGQTITITSLTTDRESQTAAAVYTYQTVIAQFGEFGALTMNAVVKANFSWHVKEGWRYTDSMFLDTTEYTGELRCHISDNGEGMADAERCSIAFDLLVIGDLICIENLCYEGGTLTPGTIHIGKTRLSASDDGCAAVISFSYVREVDNGTESGDMISGEGSITITEEQNCYYAELFFGGFITESNGERTDLVRSGIELMPITDKKIPKTESQPVSENPVVREPKKNWIGTWMAHMSEGDALSMDITAQLREDGTCEVVCKLSFGTFRRETSYKLVDDISQLPTDLMQKILYGQTPTVSVLYNADRDTLCICLEPGRYVYFSRA